MANEIITEIRLELDKFRADLKEAEAAAAKSAQKSGSTMGDGVEAGLSKGITKLSGAFIALGSTIAAAFAGKELIHAAAEQESAINALNSAMAVSGTFTESASKGFIAYAEMLQKTTTASDDLIEKNAAVLVSLGHLSGETLQRATHAALDFSAAMGIDTATAFDLVAKAAAGHATALNRYGLQVRQTGNETRDFANVLGQLEGRFKGLAELQTGTFAGALSQTKNFFNELLESIGMLVVKSPTTIAVIKAVGDSFLRASEGINEFGKGRDVMMELAETLIIVGGYVNQYLITPFEFVFNLIILGFEGTKTALQGLLAGMVELVSGVTDLLAPLGGKFAEVNAATQTFAQSTKDVLFDFAEDTGKAWDKTFEFPAAAKAAEWLGEFREFISTIEPPMVANFQAIAEKSKAAMAPSLVAGWDFIVNGFNSAFGKVELTSEKFRTGLQIKLNGAFASFRDGVVTSFSAIGAALVKGENVFSAFGKAILGVFGDLALQLGLFYFLLGLGNLFLNPAAAVGQIAAGLGLIVLGGALKALAGSGGAGGSAAAPAAGGAGGGGVAANAGIGTAPAQDFSSENIQRGQVGTHVTVNVQGNILDRRQTGLELAEVINESFGNNGVKFATGGA